MKDFDRPLVIGAVFDMTVAHGASGVRNIDVLKEALVQKTMDDDVLTKIYVAHPDWIKIPKDQGESTYYLATYQEPPSFAIDKVFKQAVQLVGDHPEDSDKYIFLMTDRFYAPHNYQYRRAFLFNNIRGYNLKICVYGFGDVYDKLTLQSLADEYGASFCHLPDASGFAAKLSELFVIGE